MNTARQQGFTLLEVLIAVAITASIGAAAIQLLHGIIMARDGTNARSNQLTALQRFNAIVSRDMEQFINRPRRDEYGDTVSALRINDGDYLIELTRTGWRNRPGTEIPRSELQHIAYAMKPIDDDDCAPALRRLQSAGNQNAELDCLVRYSWNVLDQAYDSQPTAAVVLDQIESLEISLLTVVTTDTSSESDWFTAWPAIQGGDEVMIPTAIRWQFELPWLGNLERLWLIAHDGEELQ